MQAFLVLALLIALGAATFALQNVVPVTVVFLAWTVTGSLAMVVLLAVLAGVIAALLACLPAMVRTRLQVRRLRRQVAELEGPARASAPPLDPHRPDTAPRLTPPDEH